MQVCLFLSKLAKTLILRNKAQKRKLLCDNNKAQGDAKKIIKQKLFPSRERICFPEVMKNLMNYYLKETKKEKSREITPEG